MSNENLEQGLEAAKEAKAEKRARKEYTPEEIAAIRAAGETLKTIGVSDKMELVIDAAKDWLDKDAQANARKELAEKFGSTEALKAYLEGEFVGEMSQLAGLRGLLTSLNAVAGYYKRREAPAKKVKLVQVNINKEIYSVSKEYLESIKEEPRDKKRELLLAHENTVKFQPTCADEI